MAVLWVALAPNLLVSPAAQENRYLIVNGQSSQVAVLQINGAPTPTRSALPLLTREFNNMKQLSDKYVAKRQSASYIARDSLQDDDLDKKIVTCGHALAAMVASSQFQDDGSCQ